MEKKTLLGWILDFALFAGVSIVVVVVVRFLGGSDLLAGGLAAVCAIGAIDKLK